MDGVVRHEARSGEENVRRRERTGVGDSIGVPRNSCSGVFVTVYIVNIICPLVLGGRSLCVYIVHGRVLVTRRSFHFFHIAQYVWSKRLYFSSKYFLPSANWREGRIY